MVITLITECAKTIRLKKVLRYLEEDTDTHPTKEKLEDSHDIKPSKKGYKEIIIKSIGENIESDLKSQKMSDEKTNDDRVNDKIISLLDKLKENNN